MKGHNKPPGGAITPTLEPLGVYYVVFLLFIKKNTGIFIRLFNNSICEIMTIKQKHLKTAGSNLLGTFLKALNAV